MSEEPEGSKPEGAEAETTGKRPTVEYARQLWRENKDLGFRELARLLAEQGYSIAYSTLQKIKDSDPEWATEYLQHRTMLGGPSRTLLNLELATKEGKKVTPETLMGVKARLVSRLYEQVQIVPLDDVEKWSQGVDLVSRIDGLIHAHRGMMVNPEQLAASNVTPITAGKPSLVEAVSQPRPQIDPIQAPAGGKKP